MEGLQAATQGGSVGAVSMNIKGPSTPITTIFGSLPRVDLEYQIISEELHDQIVVAIEWYYVGNDPKYKAHASYVRRDVWINVKHGLSAAGEQGG